MNPVLRKVKSSKSQRFSHDFASERPKGRSQNEVSRFSSPWCVERSRNPPPFPHRLGALEQLFIRHPMFFCHTFAAWKKGLKMLSHFLSHAMSWVLDLLFVMWNETHGLKVHEPFRRSYEKFEPPRIIAVPQHASNAEIFKQLKDNSLAVNFEKYFNSLQLPKIWFSGIKNSGWTKKSEIWSTVSRKRKGPVIL